MSSEQNIDMCFPEYTYGPNTTERADCKLILGTDHRSTLLTGIQVLWKRVTLHPRNPSENVYEIAIRWARSMGVYWLEWDRMKSINNRKIRVMLWGIHAIIIKIA